MLIFSLRMCGRLGPGGLVLPILLQIYDLLFIGQRELGGNFTCLFIVCCKAVLERAFLTGDKEKVWKFSILCLSANRLHLAIASGKSKMSRANKTK